MTGRPSWPPEALSARNSAIASSAAGPASHVTSPVNISSTETAKL
jgi:hypothetical protein